MYEFFVTLDPRGVPTAMRGTGSVDGGVGGVTGDFGAGFLDGECLGVDNGNDFDRTLGSCFVCRSTLSTRDDPATCVGGGESFFMYD